MCRRCNRFANLENGVQHFLVLRIAGWISSLYLYPAGEFSSKAPQAIIAAYDLIRKTASDFVARVVDGRGLVRLEAGAGSLAGFELAWPSKVIPRLGLKSEDGVEGFLRSARQFGWERK